MTRFEQFAFQLGHTDPDSPSPYRKGSDSDRAWRAGKEHRLMRAMTPDQIVTIARGLKASQP